MPLNVQAAIEGTADRVFQGLLLAPFAVIGMALTIFAIYWVFERMGQGR